MRKVAPESNVDAGGSHVAPGDTVSFMLDPLKPWKCPSTGILIRWVRAGVCEVSYRGKGYDGNGPHTFVVRSDEMLLVRYGGPSKQAEKQTNARLRKLRRGGIRRHREFVEADIREELLALSELTINRKTQEAE